MRKLIVGTKEQLDIHVADDLGTLTSLTGTNPTFDVLDETDAYKYQAEGASSVGMTAYCLIDTAGWTEGRYRLILNFTNLPEAPKLGPFHFLVVNP